MTNLLTEDNFREFAIQSYTNYRCIDVAEFEDDLLHIKYLKRILKKAAEEKKMDAGKMRLALNHIIILYNVFKSEPLTRMLFFKFEPPLYGILKAFLVHLSFCPFIIHDIRGKNIDTTKIRVINKFEAALKSI